MKPSGIEWIGDIPDDWEIVRMKSCIMIRDSGAWGEDAKNNEGDCICLRIADFDYNKFRFSDTNELTIRHYNSDIIEKLQLKKNDILIEKSGGGEKTPVGRTVLFDKTYTALYANFMDRLRCSNIVKPMYMQYVFVTFYKNEYTKNYIKQTTGIQNLDLTSMLSKEFIPLPSLSEQQKIVDYLDEKCGEIDKTIEKQKESIEKLKAYKQSLISETVTKGLNKSTPLKPSGIDWLGDIPQDWKVSNLSSIFMEHKEKNVGLKESNLLSLSYGKIKRKDINTNEGLLPQSFETYNIIKKDDIVFRLTDLQNDKKSLRTGIATENGIITSAYVTLRSKINVISKYFYYLFHTYDICKVFYGMGDGVRQGMGFADLKKLLILIPSISEQQGIASYLDNKCDEIDSTINKKQKIIEKLDAYKKSLIFECVTGKRKI